jgi:tetratricopeptide (TPR) repeat protein
MSHGGSEEKWWQQPRRWVLFSPDGNYFATLGRGHEVRIWKATGELAGSVRHRDAVNQAVFSPGGEYLATASYDKSAAVAKVSSGKVVARLPHSDWVLSVQFSQDQRRLLTACRDRMARLWEWETGGLACSGFEHNEAISDACFTPGERWILTLGGDGLHMWEPHTAKAVMPVLPKPNRFDPERNTITISLDGKHFALKDRDAFDVYDAADLGLEGPNELDLTGLQAWAEICAGRRILASGTTILTTPEWTRRWSEFRSKYPAYCRALTAAPKIAVADSSDRTKLFGRSGQPSGGALTYIDLTSKANWKLDETCDGNLPGYDLAALPRGEHEFAGVKFKVQTAGLQLRGQYLHVPPERIRDIPVHCRATRLFLLHGTQWGPPEYSDGMAIGQYTVHYADGTVSVIPIVYGRDLRNWLRPHMAPATHAAVAWQGRNSASADGEIRLYTAAWQNPRPASEIASLDFVSAMTECAPFCVAITAQGQSPEMTGSASTPAGDSPELPSSKNIAGESGAGNRKNHDELTDEITVLKREMQFDEARDLASHALEEFPNDPPLLQLRAEINALTGAWSAAAGDLQEYAKLASSDFEAKRKLAALLAYLEDEKAYRAVCRDMAAALRPGTSPTDRERLGKACLLLPNALPDMAKVYAAIDALDEPHYPLAPQWLHLAQGLSACRQGHPKKAVPLLKRAAAERSHYLATAMSVLVLATAYEQAGEREKAAKTLAQGLEMIDHDLPRSYELGLEQRGWLYDWLGVQIIAREARKLIPPDKTTPTSGAAAGSR